MAAWEAKKSELEALGLQVVAASVDSKEQAEEMAKKSGWTSPMAYGVTRADVFRLGAWWSKDRGGYIQPTEFLIGRGGVVLGSVYASGQVGRMGVDEAMRFINTREQRRRQQEEGQH